jgi:hypothetical protein
VRDDTLPEADALAARARAVLEAHWHPLGRPTAGAVAGGFTVPNAATYPQQFLWDSCFHAIIWAHLGVPDRAVAELAAVFAHQADDGFVPHLTYWDEPDRHADLWGRRWTSALTQPPMYGHALAELHRRGVAVPAELAAAAAAGLRFLLVERDRGDGQVVIVHPWESGCDDSPRWDPWYPGSAWDRDDGYALKGRLVAGLRRSPVGSPVGGDFEVASAAFGALVAFNVAELATVAPVGDLAPRAAAVAAHLERSWDAARHTFADTARRGAVGPEPPAVRVLEALLPVLVVPGDGPPVGHAFGALRDRTAFGGACGPAQVHRDEPVFDPGRYWRGPAWPPLSYLFWVAARRLGRTGDARALRDAAAHGARRSGLAESWHPDSGVAVGAVPQSWAALAAGLTGGSV